MAKPLRSEQVVQPKDIQFAHFGVLNAGTQSKGSVFTAIVLNVVLVLIAIIIGYAAKVTVENDKKKADLVDPLLAKPPEPKPPPVHLKPPPPPKPIPQPPIEPKVVLPEVKVEPPKVEPKVVPKPEPVVKPAPPKLVVAAVAPKPTTVNLGKSASVVNNSPHPAPVALGSANNPIAPSNRPATAKVDLGQRGLGGMPASNTGAGPRSTSVNLGSGQPNGSMNGGGARAIQGVKLGGVTNGTGTTPGNGVGVRGVQLGQNNQVASAKPVATTSAAVQTGPEVTYKPRPVYTSEAVAMHLEGAVKVKIRVSANGVVQVLGVTSGLGHGLDQSAVNTAQGMRFKPARDARGNPVDWEGVVTITFQLAG